MFFCLYDIICIPGHFDRDFERDYTYISYGSPSCLGKNHGETQGGRLTLCIHKKEIADLGNVCWFGG